MPRLSKSEVKKLYSGYMTNLEARSRGVSAYTKEDAVNRYLTRRAQHDYEQAGRMELGEQRETGSMARTEREQVGQTRRQGMSEAGQTKRQGMIEEGELTQQRRKQDFARPLQEAHVGSYKAGTALTGAQTAEAQRKTAFESSLEDLKRDELIRKEVADISAGKVLLGKDRATLAEQEEAATARLEQDKIVPPPVEAEIAKPTKPKRKLRPWVNKALYGQESPVPYTTPFGKRTHIPGILDAYRGYTNMADWLKDLGVKTYNYAYPPRR